MRYKILFFIFLIFFFLYVIVSYLNPDNVKLYVGYGKFYEGGLADFIVLSFVFGVIISMVVSFFGDIRNAVIAWRERKQDKRRDEYRDIIERARAYDLKGDREKAIENLTRLVRRGADIEEPYTVLADVYSSMKEFDKAIETLNLAETTLGKKETILLKIVKANLAMKKMDKVEAGLKEVIALNESNLDALGLLRDVYICRKDWNEAIAMEKRLQRFIKTGEEKRRLIGLRYEIAYSRFNDRDFDSYESIATELKEIISEDKRFVPAYILLAEAYKKMDKPNEAARVYGRGWAKTGHIIFLLKMEDFYIDRGDPGVTLKIYRRILEVSQKNHLTLFLYARLCLRLEMIDEAIDTLNQLLAEGEEFRGLHRAMAEAYAHRGELEKAVEEFRVAFPMKHVYIPFKCGNCQSRKEEWMDFCESCSSWNTINVQTQDFLLSEPSEMKMLYDREDWDQEG